MIKPENIESVIVSLQEDQVNSGLLFGYKLLEDDWFGYPGRHCVYVRGYD